MSGAVCPDCGCYVSDSISACPACGKHKTRAVKAIYIGINGEAVKVWDREQGVTHEAGYDRAMAALAFKRDITTGGLEEVLLRNVRRAEGSPPYGGA